MRNYPVVILSAVNTGSATGSGFYVAQGVAASFTVVNGDATAAGAVKIQISNEPAVGAQPDYIPTTASWSDVPNATSTIASGVGPAIILPSLSCQYVRAIYTRSSGGSTTIKVTMSALGV